MGLQRKNPLQSCDFLVVIAALGKPLDHEDLIGKFLMV